MTYTTQQLQAMSDFEVNKALAERLGLKVLEDVDPLHNDTSAVYHNGCISEEYNGTNIDYCNNLNDIMPLAFERGISLIKTESHEEWQACVGVDIDCGDISYDECLHDAKPLRAIACLLLLMED